MATRAPFSGGGEESAKQPAEPTAMENLAEVERLLEAQKPWPAFLRTGAETLDEWDSCPEIVHDALEWMVTSGGGLLDIASVGPLTPACQAFQALIAAVRGSAEVQEELRELISWCASLVRVFIKRGKTVDALSDTDSTSSLQDFIATTNELAKRAKVLATRRKFKAVLWHRKDSKEIAGFGNKLRNIWADVRGLTVLDIKASLEEMKRPLRLEPMAAIPPGAIALPDSHVERTSLVEEVVRSLTGPDAATNSSAHLLLGMGGGGKTVLASSVVRHEAVLKHFRQGVFWVRVGQGGKDQLQALFQGLAREIGATRTDTRHAAPFGFSGLEEIVQHLAAVSRSSKMPRLVVLDDVWEREVVDALLPTGLVLLVTSRDRSVAVRAGCTNVGDMTDDEALTPLGRASGSIGTPGTDVRVGMQQVARDCGFTPMALAIAGSMPVVKGQGSSALAWQQLHKNLENKEEMLRQKGGAVKSISHVLDASFDALGKNKQAHFMSLAVLPKAVVAPLEMLMNLWNLEDKEDCRDAARGLIDRSLLQAVGSSGYRVHDLLLDFAKESIKPAPLEKAASLQALYLGRLDVVKGYADEGNFLESLYSLMALWRPVERVSNNPRVQVEVYRANFEALGEDKSDDVAMCYLFVGLLLMLEGKYEDADIVSKQALAINEEVYGQDHPQVVATLVFRAELSKKQGKYEDADVLCQRALLTREKEYGRDHPELVWILNSRAWLLVDQGKYEDADVLYQRALAIEEEVYGKDHHEVAKTLSYRAMLLRSQGKYEDADVLYQRALAIEEEVYGQDHHEVATTLSNRAMLLRSQGKYEDADVLYQRALAIKEKVYGQDHHEVAKTLSNRAMLLRSQGKYEDADVLYQRALAINEEVYGNDHHEVAKTLSNRAMLLRSQGKYEDADVLYQRALAIEEKVYGQDHHEVATTLSNRAILLGDLGKYEDADVLYQRALAIEEKVYGQDHHEVATTLSNWAMLLVDLGKYEDADVLYQRALAINEKVYGQDHHDVATTLSNRAMLLRTQGKYEDADVLYQRALAIKEKVYGQDHHEVATTLSNRAMLLVDLGKYEDADVLCQRALAIKEMVYGQDHHEVATTLHNRAMLLVDLGKYEDADVLYQRALAIEEEVYGQDHHDVATTLSNRAMLLRSQGKYEDADVLYRRALIIREKVYGQDHHEVARALVWRADLVGKQGKYEEAGRLHERAIRMFEAALGKEHTLVAFGLRHWALLLKTQGKYDEALLLHQRASDITEKTLGANHPQFAEDLNHLGELLRNQGRDEEAAPLYERAIEIWKSASASDHPKAAIVLTNLANLREAQGKHDEALPLLESALAIRQEALGETHKDTVDSQARLNQARQPQVQAAPPPPGSE
eukprot:g10571.t1